MKARYFHSQTEKTTTIEQIPETRHIYRSFHSRGRYGGHNRRQCINRVNLTPFAGSSLDGQSSQTLNQWSFQTRAQKLRATVNPLTGFERLSSRECLWSELMDTEATAWEGEEIDQTSEETALVGIVTIVWAEDVTATVWGCTSVAKAGDVETAEVAAIGLLPSVGAAVGDLQEGDQGLHAIWFRAYGWSLIKLIGWLDANWKGKCRKRQNGYVDGNTSVGRQQKLRPTQHNPIS